MTAPFLTGQRALVTGGTKGIGYEIARALRTAGASVVICGRSQDSVDKAAAELGITGKAADVADEASVNELFRFVEQELGGLDILVNNAGIGIFKPVADLTVSEWRQVIGTNLDSAFYCTHAALPLLRKQGGSILNISSLAAKNPFAGGAAYNASKFGLNGFAEALMLDHRNDGVRVTSIMPGSVDTGFSPRSQPAPWKIAPEDIAQIVLDVLRMPTRTLISRVEVRPSQPPK